MEALQSNQGFEFPDDVSHYIVALLPVWDVCSLSACSRHWRILCSSNFVWYDLYNKRWRLENVKKYRVEDSLKHQRGNHSSMLLNSASPVVSISYLISQIQDYHPQFVGFISSTSKLLSGEAYGLLYIAVSQKLTGFVLLSVSNVHDMTLMARFVDRADIKLSNMRSVMARKGVS
ncbi:hypothetical protein L7F22_049032 [Adiantum nelumboides]|nr:hypothetical protein [Adiantum nelumboides]